MKHRGYTTENRCRSCKKKDPEEILFLGKPPLADRLVNEKQLGREEPLVPLTLVRCPACTLLQIRESVDPDILFRDNYPYFSSTSESYVRHARNYAEEVMARRSLNTSQLVMEIACNDGYMLKNFIEKGIPVLGIDPAAGPAEAARQKNIPVRVDFFDTSLAEELAVEDVSADVLIANNVLAHVPDPNELVRAASMVLKDNGLMVAEVPWIVELLEKNEFDTIYHQHFSYFSLTALDKLFRRHQMYINDAKPVAVQGGSVRLFIEKQDNPSTQVGSLFAIEQEKQIGEPGTYRLFAEKTKKLCHDLRELLRSLKEQGFRIAGYGAAAKAATMLHYCGIGEDVLDFVVDRNPFKHGKYMGENHLRIYPVEKLMEDKPDYVLLLSWNLADEILAQQQEFRSQGGRFVIPIPSPEIV